MKQTFVVEPYTWRNIPGHVVLEVTTIAPGDLAKQRDPAGHPLKNVATIGEWRQRFGGSAGDLTHPFSRNKYRFDLAPWSHLDPTTYLWLTWKFQPEHPIPLSDPRYPRSSRP